MMKHALIYSTKVWLTGVIFSPIVFFSTLGVQDPDLNSVIDYTWLMMMFGFAYSIPSWIFLVVTSWLVLHFMNREFLRRGIIWIVSMLLCLLPFLYIGFYDDEFTFVLPYMITISSGVWYYRLKPQNTDEEHSGETALIKVNPITNE
jgi:fatty acid desaturase